VTPPETAAAILSGTGFGSGAGRNCFNIYPATEDGNSVLSLAQGGSVPGLPANGVNDLYESVRGPGGWTTISKSAASSETNRPAGGMCASADHRYSTLLTDSLAAGDEGTFVVEGKQTSYVRDPAGGFALVGQGENGTDPEANARWITPGASHIIFTSRRQLEPDAPPVGKEAIYDRTPGAPTQVVSLPPEGSPPATLTEFQNVNAAYQGSSADGTAVAFKVGTTMYVRSDNLETTKVVTGATAYAGMSPGGDVLFYATGNGATPGTLFAFVVASETATEIAPGSIFVNVSEDGSRAYFTSKSALTGTETNSQGQAAVAAENNLYAWDRAADATQFVAVLDPKDLQTIEGMSLIRWTNAAVSPNVNVQTGRANDPSRTTADGSTLVFESRADITDYESDGHIQIYRFDEEEGALDCVSCPPLGLPTTSDARLQVPVGTPFRSAGPLLRIQNVTADGQKVMFETQEPLLSADRNSTWDVYEWKAGQQPYLISSGEGSLPSHLYGMTASGSDVFFTTSDRLVPRDLSTVSSIYDARTGGGFPEGGQLPPCQGDACQGAAGAAPSLATPGSAALQGTGNQKPKSCKKNERRAKRNGKVRCVKKHAKKRPAKGRQGDTNKNRGAAR
jgi:hypothetical protein